MNKSKIYSAEGGISITDFSKTNYARFKSQKKQYFIISMGILNKEFSINKHL